MDDHTWADFTQTCTDVFDSLRGCTEGAVADYIPQLAEADPEQFGLSIVTVDGRTFERGDVDHPVCVQSCCKPLLYGVALDERGEACVTRHVGKEPSGSKFNDFKFDQDGKPFNPLINAGAIMAAALVQPGRTPDKRFHGFAHSQPPDHRNQKTPHAAMVPHHAPSDGHSMASSSFKRPGGHFEAAECRLVKDPFASPGTARPRRGRSIRLF